MASNQSSGSAALKERIAEKSLILAESSKSVLLRLYHSKKIATDPKTRSSIFSNKDLDSCIKSILKKFPNVDNFNSQTQNTLSELVNQIQEEFTQHVDVMMDFYEFKVALQELLTTCSSLSLELDLCINCVIVAQIFDAITNMMACFTLLNRFEEKKIILILYKFCAEILSRADMNVVSCLKLVTFISDHDKNWKKIQEEFSGFALLVGNGFTNLLQDYTAKSSEANSMKFSSYCSLTVIPENIPHPKLFDYPDVALRNIEDISRWVVFIVMLLPEALNNFSSLSNLLNAVLSRRFALTVIRDEVINPLSEISDALKSVKSVSKKLNDIKNAPATPSVCLQTHRERMKYFAMLVEETSYLTEDLPGLMGPKLFAIIEMLSHIKGEISFWLSHYVSDPCIKAKKLREEMFGSFLPSLVYYYCKLLESAKQYYPIVRRYYLQFLTGYDLSFLENFIDTKSSALDRTQISMLNAIRNQLQKLKQAVEKSETGATTGNNKISTDTSVSSQLSFSENQFLPIRLDVSRLLVYHSISERRELMASNGCRDKEFVCFVNNLIFHTYAIDSYKLLFDRYAIYPDAVFFTESLNAFFKDATNLPKFSRFIMFPVYLLSYVDPNSYWFTPEEVNLISHVILTHVCEYLEKISEKFVFVLMAFMEDSLDLSRYLDGANAANIWIKRCLVLNPDLSKKFPVPVLVNPGDETRNRLMDECNSAEDNFRQLNEMCSVFADLPVLHIPKKVIFPSYFLSGPIEKFCYFFFTNNSKCTDSNCLTIKRPSEMLTEVKVLLNVISFISMLVGADLNRVFCVTLLQQSMMSDLNQNLTLTSLYAKAYLEEFLRKKFYEDVYVYSAVRESFLVKNSSTSHIDEYTDINEFYSLAQLVGPFGIKNITSQFSRAIVLQLTNLKKILKNHSVNMKLLGEANLVTEPLDEMFKKIKGDEEEVFKSLVNIGSAMVLQRNMQKGLKLCLENSAPFLMKTLRYASSVYSNDENILRLNEACGEGSDYDLSILDHVDLKEFPDLDETLWLRDFFRLVGIMMTHMATRDDSIYAPHNEVHSNNLHVCATAIRNLLIILNAIYFNKVGSDKATETAVKAAQFCGILYIRMYEGSLCKEKCVNRDSVFITFDMIFGNNPLISESIVEEIIPYSLISSCYAKIYENRGAGKKAPKESSNMA